MPLRGARTKLTPERQKLIIDALSVGATHRICCEYAGITTETFYTWLEKGQTGRAPYADFSDQVAHVQGRTAVGWLAKIEAAANAGDWKAVAWKLERRYPDEYGTAVLKHTGPQGGAIVLRVVYEGESEA